MATCSASIAPAKVLPRGIGFRVQGPTFDSPFPCEHVEALAQIKACRGQEEN